MLKRHRQLRRHSRSSAQWAPDAAVPVVRAAPAALISLPTLELVQPAFVANANAGNSLLKTCADALSDAGILRPEHLAALGQNPYPDDDLQQLVATAISDVARKARPRPVAQLDLLFADDAVRADLEYPSAGSGQSEYEIRKRCIATQIGVISVQCRTDSPVHQLIGPKIIELEAIHAGLGETVIHWLSAGLDKSTRACDPVSGYGWAQACYWQGEADESTRLEEEMDDAKDWWDKKQQELPASDRQPFDPASAAKELGLFTRQEYDTAIPPWAGSQNQPRLTAKQLQRLRVPRAWRPTVDATIAMASLLSHAPRVSALNDLGCFELTRWEICPFLLRWDRPSRAIQDPLGMIWDDFLNQEFQAGETNMAANAVFAWHDGPSLVDAVRRLELWCRILQAAENLLLSLHPITIP